MASKTAPIETEVQQFVKLVQDMADFVQKNEVEEGIQDAKSPLDDPAIQRVLNWVRAYGDV